LTSGELAINITDGKLYYKDNGGVVQVIATKGAGTIGGSTTQIQYNNAGALAGNAAMTFNSGTNTTTLTTLNLTNALGAVYGGTAQSTYTQGDVLYASASNTLSKLGIGTVNYILTSSGSVPQWSAPSSISVLTATNLAGGLGGSVPYQSAVDTTTFLAIGAANRVMTSTGSAPQWVTSLTGLTGVSSSSITNTSLTSGRVVYSGASGVQTDSASLTFNGTTLSAGGFSTTGLSTLVQTVKIGDSNFSGVAVFAPATPAKLYIGTGTVTDATSAIGATNTTGAISSLAITPIAATNTSVTYTNASTLYIAGAPSAGTNITITNPYALYVAAGASYFGGAVTFAGSASLAGLTVTSLTDSGLTSGRVTYATTGGLLTDSANLLFDGTTLQVNGSTAPTTGPILRVDNTATTAYNAAVFVGGQIKVNYTNATSRYAGINFSNTGATSQEFFGTVQNASGYGDFVWQGFAGSYAERMRLASTGFLTVVGGATIQGLTVGLGAGAVATNTVVGNAALSGSNTGDVNTAIGYQALKVNTSGQWNVGVGAYALTANQGGVNNTAMGRALVTNVSGTDNTAIGMNALYYGTASYNTAVGSNALINSTATYNTALGYQSGYLVTSGLGNVFIGANAGYGAASQPGTTSAVMIGYNAGSSSFVGSVGSVIIGRDAGYNINRPDGAVFIGTSAGFNSSNALNSLVKNTYIGYQSGYGAAGGGYDNTALGAVTLSNISTGIGNIAIGAGAGPAITSGSSNIAIGASNTLAGSGGTTSSYNIAIGGGALGLFALNSAYGFNIAIGQDAGGSVVTGTANTYIGTGYALGAGRYMTGSYNTVLGAFSSSYYGLDLTSSSNRIVLSDGAGEPKGLFDTAGFSTDVAASISLTGGGAAVALCSTVSIWRNTNTLQSGMVMVAATGSNGSDGGWNGAWLLHVYKAFGVYVVTVMSSNIDNRGGYSFTFTIDATSLYLSVGKTTVFNYSVLRLGGGIGTG
jgi:hypothetical protein